MAVVAHLTAAVAAATDLLEEEDIVAATALEEAQATARTSQDSTDLGRLEINCGFCNEERRQGDKSTKNGMVHLLIQACTFIPPWTGSGLA
jgi:hypothetical protein